MSKCIVFRKGNGNEFKVYDSLPDPNKYFRYTYAYSNHIWYWVDHDTFSPVRRWTGISSDLVPKEYRAFALLMD